MHPTHTHTLYLQPFQAKLDKVALLSQFGRISITVCRHCFDPKEEAVSPMKVALLSQSGRLRLLTVCRHCFDPKEEAVCFGLKEEAVSPMKVALLSVVTIWPMKFAHCVRHCFNPKEETV